jgi:hypothetical protein
VFFNAQDLTSDQMQEIARDQFCSTFNRYWCWRSPSDCSYFPASEMKFAGVELRGWLSIKFGIRVQGIALNVPVGSIPVQEINYG